MQWPEDIVAPFSFEGLEWLEKRHEMPAFGEEKPDAARSEKMNSRGRLLDSCGMRVRRSICTCVYERGWLKYAVRGSISCHSSLRKHRHLQRSSIVLMHISGILKRRDCIPHWDRKKFYKRTKAAQLLSQSRRSVEIISAHNDQWERWQDAACKTY